MDLMKQVVIFKRIIIMRGTGSDYVNAGSRWFINHSMSLNNANFSTPIDGNRGRMQMFCGVEVRIKPLIVTSPESL
jgi:hypothetical protein